MALLKKRSKPYTILNHTADIGLSVCGATKEKLFINAGYGLLHLLLRANNARSVAIQKKIIFSGIDDETLLVSWLEELLYLIQTKHRAPIVIDSLVLQDKQGIAQIRVAPAGNNPLPILREIKAVTYHQLAIKKISTHYNTRIYFDV